MKSKRSREIEKLISEFTLKANASGRVLKLEEAIDILQSCPKVKFDQSVEVALKTGIDSQKSDQQVRSVVSLPNGTGKKTVVVVFAKSNRHKEALDAGADIVGQDDLFERIQKGFTDFDAVIATPDMMGLVGKLGKVLGPRGLMPAPKAGTLTNDIATAVREIKAGRIEFKTDKHAVISAAVGKLSFSKEKLLENILAFVGAVSKMKPATAKGQFLQTMSISSSMGPGLKVEISRKAGD